MTQTGGCLCGRLRYEIEGEPAMMGICHCRNCQRQAGSAFSTLAGVATPNFRYTAGEPTCYRDEATDSGNPVSRYFCGHCGSPIHSGLDANPDMVFVKTGTLDDVSGFRPQFHVWCDSKQPWVTLDDALPQMAQQS